MQNSLSIRNNNAVDLVRDSLDHVIAISFPKSRSASYLAAVNIAQQADKYSEIDMGGTPFHFAAFGRSKEQVAFALSVTRYLSGIKAAQFFAGGKLVLEQFRIEAVLTCYLEACACKDHLAHCNKVVSNPYSGHALDNGAINLDFNKSEKNGYLFPCAYLLQWGNPGLQHGHPSSPQNQIQAMAVKKGCDWCPNFKPEAFKKL